MTVKCDSKCHLAHTIYSNTCIVTCIFIYIIMIITIVSNSPGGSTFSSSLWTKSRFFFRLSLFLELFDYISKGSRDLIKDPYFTAILLLLKSSIVFLILNFEGFVSKPLYVWAFIFSETFITLVKHLNIVLKTHNKQFPFVEYLDKTISLYAFFISTFSQILMVMQALPEMKANQYFRWFPSPLPNKFNFFIDLYVTLIVLIFASLISSIGTYYRRSILNN